MPNLTPGARTTENWLSWSTVVLGAWFGLAEGDADITTPEAIVKAAAFLAMGLAAAGYAISRGHAKGGAA